MENDEKRRMKIKKDKEKQRSDQKNAILTKQKFCNKFEE